MAQPSSMWAARPLDESTPQLLSKWTAEPRWVVPSAIARAVMVAITASGCGAVTFQNMSQSPAIAESVAAGPASQAPGKSAETSGRGGEAQRVPAGTEFEARLDQAIDTRTSVGGEIFTATLTQPVSVDGSVVVPAGTRLRGTIEEIVQSPARVELALDSIALPGGWVPIAVRVLSVEQSHEYARSVSSNVANGQSAQMGIAERQALDASSPISMPRGALVRLRLTSAMVAAP